ncbi:hypothetical protein TAMA11512_07220 [Selenomonas sp. TAMA-11512]|uniref:flagellar hook-basal body complex protein n=1 Tax=Selenomonas sp. TAMA-11512 TaxID=3095337 RepID=UPI00308AC854|nr:hypothetical protein TAMA11512_07220 [Selenomonas sp. TAMA-11512]
MMRSLFSGVSGLKSHQTRMDSIGNNIANVNTTGYKSTRVTFADTLYQTSAGASAPKDRIGGTNPKQIGLGVGVSAIDTIFTDSSAQSTGKNTDLALNGNGLFVVKRGDETYYTRDGNFSFDAEGNYVLSGSGLYVQGWMADAAGKIAPSPSTEKITIKAGKGMDADPTKMVNYTNNLRGDSPIYKVLNMAVKYVDGTSETTTNYAPTEKGTISLTTNKNFYVTLDDTATYNFQTGQPITGKTLWTSKVDTVTATGPAANDGSVDLTLAVDPTDPTGPRTVTGLHVPLTVESGTYRYGDKFSFSQTIEDVDATGAGPGMVKLKLTDNNKPTKTGITQVTVPMPTTFSYKVGDTFTGHLKINKIDNIKDKAVVKAKNGQSATGEHFPGLSVASATTAAVCEGVVSDGNVEVVHRKSGYAFNGKEVESVNLQTEDGQSLTGMVGKSYLQNDLFSPPIATVFTVYDTQGRPHKVTVNFTRVPAKDNTWELSIGRGAASDTMTGEDFSETNVALSSTELVFDENGRYKSGEGSLTMTFTSPNGAQDSRVISLNLAALTQYAGGTTIKGDADGYAAGSLASVQIDSSGVITGVYTNSVMRTEAQVAVAQFNNAAGLQRSGNNLYQISNNSGSAAIGTSTDLGCKITPGALEMSNVDIANEFSDMIITQRGFQSNSKIITVGDEMLETVINMKR